MQFRMLALAAGLSVSCMAWAADEAPKADAPAAAKAAAVKAPQKDYVILRVAGEPVMASEVEDLWKSLFPGAAAPDFNTFDEKARQQVLRGVASEHLVYQQAVSGGFDKSEDVKKRMESLKRQVILQSFMEDKAKSLVTDAQLQDAYAKKIAGMKDQEEVHARHILVPGEEEAKAIYKELKKGGNFEKIAKEKSLDKNSGVQGGDLGWFTKDKMVPQFAEAAFKLKKGEISEPVKTEFGWHIIKVDDRRKLRIPSFDEMKDSLRAELTPAALQAYVDSLAAKADIKYYTPDGTEKTLPPATKK